jgi:hypothetical protein
MSKVRNQVAQILEERVAEEATGCSGAGGYRRWAEAQGYTHCEVWNLTSSAGDWQFLVSKNGYEWYLMEQTNNYPRPGFTREICDGFPFPLLGTKEEVCQELAKFEGLD